MEPKIIKSILDDEGDVTEEARWSVVRQVVEPEAAAALKTLLACATEYGTGKNARVTELAVSGKTGTAQKVAQLLSMSRTVAGSEGRSRRRSSRG